MKAYGEFGLNYKKAVKKSSKEHMFGMKIKSAFIGLLLLATIPLGIFGMDLNMLSQSFVLEKKQIHVPGYPHAFNPSIVRWKGKILMCFRVLTNPNNIWHSKVGLIWLDEDFQPISSAQLLETRPKNPTYPTKSEDARLFTVGEQLYIIYNDNEEFYDDGLRRMFMSEVLSKGSKFYVNPECLHTYEDANQYKWEKNWIPFDYHGVCLLAYSIVPHRIYLPLFGLGTCETVVTTDNAFIWNWGNKRIFGGTPALMVGDKYLAFFHSSQIMGTAQTDYYETWHYFMGAYTFNPDPPFEITHASILPIIGQGLYDDPIIYKRVVFPGGFIFDDEFIWISYGREDSEAWVLKLDRKELLKRLVPVIEGL